MLDKIVPPDDPKKVTNWRWFLTIAVALLLIDTTAGRSGVLGFGAYALASDIEAQNAKIDAASKKIDTVIALQISTILRGLHQERCRSNGSRETIELTIEDYQQEYIDVTGRRYPLPACEAHRDEG